MDVALSKCKPSRRRKGTKITAKTNAEKVADLQAEREAILAELAGMQSQPTYNFVN